jgi:tetratricopeptide (TPR) repeat protein
VLAVAASVIGFLAQGAFGFTVVGCGGLFATLAGLLSRFGESEAADAPAPRGLWFPFGLTTAALLAGVIFGLNFAGEERASVEALAVSSAALGVVLLLSLYAVFRAVDATAAGERFPVAAACTRARPGPGSVLWRRAAAGAVWVGTAVAFVVGIGCPLQANVLCCTGERLLSDRPREAVQALACAVLLDPTKELHWTKLAAVAEAAAARVALSEVRRELFSMARTSLERAGRLSPRNAYHHANLGKVLGKMARAGLARPDEAYAAFDQALALDPQNVTFYADAAFAALGLEDVAKARDYATRGTRLCPDYAPARAYLGYLALREGRFAEATTLLCEANAGAWHDRAAERALALANLGTAYLRLRLFEHSASASRQALALAPRLAEAGCNLGLALEMLGRPAQAAEAYLQTLAHSPGHAKARAGLDRLGVSANR